MVNKPFLLLGLAAEYRSRRRRRWCANNIAADHQMFITLTGQLSWQRLRRSAVDLYSKAKNRSLTHPLGHLGVTYALHRWKARSQLWTFFRYLLWLRRYERKSVEVGVFRRGWVTLNADFRGKGASPTNHSWYQSNIVIALSCGIKISAVRHLVLSQCTRVTDRRTDGRTDGRTELRLPRPPSHVRAVKM